MRPSPENHLPPEFSLDEVVPEVEDLRPPEMLEALDYTASHGETGTSTRRYAKKQQHLSRRSPTSEEMLAKIGAPSVEIREDYED